MLININTGVFVGDCFCPNGFVLLGGTWVYFLKTVLKNGVHIIFGCTNYTQVNMVYLHITSKNCLPTLSGKKRTVLKLSLTVYGNSKVFLSLDFITCTTCRREKILASLMTLMKMEESSQDTYVVTSCQRLSVWASSNVKMTQKARLFWCLRQQNQHISKCHSQKTRESA